MNFIAAIEDEQAPAIVALQANTGNFLGGSDRRDVYNEKRSIRKVKMNPKDI